ncbi:alpha/beta fold hydrolase [Klebsiella pneumoniae]|nr:alpha/beta fold hydrolase [Klebsiella pneumoniae]AZQ28170.1 alpha/beta fold hydrolase [Klebsiella pneumoniae]HBR4202892.1 alpha/beta fold hydrolase [Klebsiella pneumoniae]
MPVGTGLFKVAGVLPSVLHAHYNKRGKAMYLKKVVNQSLVVFTLISPVTSIAIAKTGTVVTKMPLDPAHGLLEAKSQYRIEYTAVDGVRGKGERTDSAAVFIPFGPEPEGGWPVIVWTHGTVGINSDCAPSLNTRTARDSQYLNTWLSLGYAVVAPDYPGLGSDGMHHYLNAQGEGWSVLDGIRAALTEFPLKNELVLVGQSQGAHAAFAAAGYQPTYAPELNIIGTVLTGTPYFSAESDVASLFTKSDDKNQSSGDPKIPYIFYIWQSAADTNPTLKAENYFQNAALAQLDEAKALCITPLTQKVMHNRLNMNNSLTPNIQSLLTNALPSLSYPTLKITHPVFIGIGGDDINVPTAMQQQFAKDVQAAGTHTNIHLYPGLDHSGAVNPSLRDSVPFVLGLKDKP